MNTVSPSAKGVACLRHMEVHVSRDTLAKYFCDEGFKNTWHRFFQSFEESFASEKIRGNQRQCCESADMGCAHCVFADDGGEISGKAGMGHAVYYGGFDGDALFK